MLGLYRMKIGYVCTNYNNSGFTAQAVESLAKVIGHDISIVVVDNDSLPTSVSELREVASQHANVELILERHNHGYFRGLNIGIRHIRNRHPDIEFIVAGNNDLVFPVDFGHALDQALDTLKGHAVVSPDVITMDGVHQNPHVITRVSAFREFMYDVYYSNYYVAKFVSAVARISKPVTDRSDETQWEKPRLIWQGHGSCYILGPEFFRNFEELWAPTFLMGEEFFLSKQLADKGMRVYYEPRIRVQHHCHASVSRVPAKRMWELSRQAHKIYRQHVRFF